MARLPLCMQHPPNGHQSRDVRLGIGSVELIVALTLLSTALTVSTQLLIRSQAILDDHRDCRLALDELSNLVDQLTALPAEEMEARLADLAPSDRILAHLPNASLEGEVTELEQGRRVTLHLSWNVNHESRKTLHLSGWNLSPVGGSAGNATPSGATSS